MGFEFDFSEKNVPERALYLGVLWILGLMLLGCEKYHTIDSYSAQSGDSVHLDQYSSDSTQDPPFSNPELSPIDTKPDDTKQVLKSTQQLPGKRFKVIWLEPHSINQNVTPRDRLVTRQMIHRTFGEYKKMGIETVVIAHSESLGYYTFQPSQQLRNNYPAATEVLKVSDETQSGQVAMLDAIFEAADANKLRVIVGLSQFGDSFALNRLETDLRLATDRGESDPNKIFQKPNVDALNNLIILNKMLANDIYFRYLNHPSFYGWYLAHEPHCLDVAMNLFGSVASFLRRLDSNKKIMISPNADTEVCFGPKVSSQWDHILNMRAYLNKMKSSGIDIIAYQDSLGAGFQAGKFQFLSFAGNWLAIISQYVAPLYSLYHFNEVSRTNRLNYLRHIIFPGMPYIHDRTGVEFWINTELWRMDGHCMGQTGVYGCNYPGVDFSNQLKFGLIILRP
ncbi:MAG: DUF4434 domain-containing protein [Bdellovibrionales bacterium]|nr:DUF4434 domain-containing protein [Bdellovibrionales bacterium]